MVLNHGIQFFFSWIGFLWFDNNTITLHVIGFFKCNMYRIILWINPPSFRDLNGDLTSQNPCCLNDFFACHREPVNIQSYLLVDDHWYISYLEIPIRSMYGIFTYIYHKNQPNVGKYTIHGSYGICFTSGNISLNVDLEIWEFFQGHRCSGSLAIP